MKIRDRIILGTIAGLAGGVPARLINAIEYHTGITDVKYGHMASSLFLDNKLKTREGEIIAAITNAVNTSMVGVGIVYLLALSGRDNAVIKGAGVAASTWVGIYGLTTRLKISVKSKKPRSPILGFVDHVIGGAFAGWLISKLGHDSLFPTKDESILFEKEDSSLGNTGCLQETRRVIT